MILVDQTAVPLATPRAVSDLGGTLNESQWILTANILPLAAFMSSEDVSATSSDCGGRSWWAPPSSAWRRRWPRRRNRCRG
jgi:hypothetical protein